jgi:hypothetical protein
VLVFAALTITATLQSNSFVRNLLAERLCSAALPIRIKESLIASEVPKAAPKAAALISESLMGSMNC